MNNRRDSGGAAQQTSRETASLDDEAMARAIDEEFNYRQLAVIERYERFIEYMYSILIHCPRTHRVARDFILQKMFEQVELFNIAGKSDHPLSRLHSADSNLAVLRWLLRFMVFHPRKILSHHQRRQAERHLREVGGMVNAWIKKTNEEQRLRKAKC